jgi:ribosomal protein L37AE/L43A
MSDVNTTIRELGEKEATGGQKLLTTLEQQALFIAKMQSQPAKCPTCQSPVSALQALATYLDCGIEDLTIDEFAGSATGDDDHECPHCGSRLRKNVALFHGQISWTLSEKDANYGVPQ